MIQLCILIVSLLRLAYVRIMKKREFNNTNYSLKTVKTIWREAILQSRKKTMEKPIVVQSLFTIENWELLSSGQRKALIKLYD